MKHMGWFDDRENATSVLVAAMAEDTSIVNNISTEGLAPQIEGNMAMLSGIGLGLYFCWPEALACIALSPFMIIGRVISTKIRFNQSNQEGEEQKDANLLCGDAILNYKTV